MSVRQSNIQPGTNLREALVKAARLKPIGQPDPGLQARWEHQQKQRDNFHKVVRRQVRQKNDEIKAAAAQAAANSRSTAKKTPSKTKPKAK